MTSTSLQHNAFCQIHNLMVCLKNTQPSQPSHTDPNTELFGKTQAGMMLASLMYHLYVAYKNMYFLETHFMLCYYLNVHTQFPVTKDGKVRSSKGINTNQETDKQRLTKQLDATAKQPTILKSLLQAKFIPNIQDICSNLFMQTS